MSEAAANADPERTGMEPCDVPRPRWRDWVVAFAGALILTDAFDAVLSAVFGWRAMLMPGVPIARLPLLVVFALAGLLLAGDLRRAAHYVRATWLLWPAVVLAFVSALWSQQPTTTLLWAVALVGTSAFGVALAVRFSASAQAVLTAAVVTSIALGSMLAALLWPEFGVSRRGWRGLYVHRNLLGKHIALGVAALFPVALNARRRGPPLLALLLCAGVLVQTRSRASILAAFAAVVAAMLLLAARTWRHHATAILASGTAVSILIVTFLIATPAGLALLKKEATLSGRTRIWKGVAEGALESPWLGHGYGAFWASPSGQNARARIRMRLNQAHNGAVDLYAELGLAGLVLVLVPLGVYGGAALRHALREDARACLWPATYLVFFVASNAGESALLRHKIFWALYVAAVCHVATQSSLCRPRPRAGPTSDHDNPRSGQHDEASPESRFRSFVVS